MPNIQDFEWPYNGSDAREQAYDEGESLMRKVEELDEQLRQEREAREKYENILRKLIEAQDEIDIEAEKPLHQRSTAPIVKKLRAIEEARQVLGGGECSGK